MNELTILGIPMILVYVLVVAVTFMGDFEITTSSMLGLQLIGLFGVLLIALDRPKSSIRRKN